MQLAHGLERASHDVAFACAPSLAPAIERLGFRCFPGGFDWLEWDAAASFPELREMTLDRVTILDQDVAGVVVGAGARVRRWRVGEEVIAATGIRMGGHAEYVRLDEHGVMAAKPQNASFEEAATLAVGGVDALQFIRQAAIAFTAHPPASMRIEMTSANSTLGHSLVAVRGV